MSPNVCDKGLLIWGQTRSTCWFNVILASLLYSDGVRKLMIKASKSWDNTIELYRIFTHILQYKYIRSTSPIEDYAFFINMSPQKILRKFHRYDPISFPVKEFNAGFNTMLYIKKIYDFLQLDNMMIVLHTDDTVAYDSYCDVTDIMDITMNNKKAVKVNVSYHNEEYINSQLLRTPDILIIRVDGKDVHKSRSLYTKYPYYMLKNENNIHNIKSRENIIVYNNALYKLDTITIDNWNVNINNVSGHAIAVVNCKGNTYVYNSALRLKEGEVKRPCDLIPFNLEQYKNLDFHIHGCKVFEGDTSKTKTFSLDKGRRIMIYVKQGNISDSPTIETMIPNHVHYQVSPSSNPNSHTPQFDQNTLETSRGRKRNIRPQSSPTGMSPTARKSKYSLHSPKYESPLSPSYLL